MRPSPITLLRRRRLSFHHCFDYFCFSCLIFFRHFARANRTYYVVAAYAAAHARAVAVTFDNIILLSLMTYYLAIARRHAYLRAMLDDADAFA